MATNYSPSSHPHEVSIILFRDCRLLPFPSRVTDRRFQHLRAAETICCHYNSRSRAAMKPVCPFRRSSISLSLVRIAYNTESCRLRTWLPMNPVGGSLFLDSRWVWSSRRIVNSIRSWRRTGEHDAITREDPVMSTLLSFRRNKTTRFQHETQKAIHVPKLGFVAFFLGVGLATGALILQCVSVRAEPGFDRLVPRARPASTTPAKPLSVGDEVTTTSS